MDINCSVAIMAHPKREEFIPELEKKLDKEPTIVWDKGNDRWDTGRRSMLAYDPKATHHLVVQDDALICQDLVSGVEKALSHLPDPQNSPMCLYIGRVRPQRRPIANLVARAKRHKASFIKLTQMHWGVGIVMPTRYINEMVTWADRRADIKNYDLRIGRWLQHKQIPVYYPWPSLVDHRDSPSLVPGRTGRGRRAHVFIGTTNSALDHDWSGTILTPSGSDRRKYEADRIRRKRAAKQNQ